MIRKIFTLLFLCAGVPLLFAQETYFQPQRMQKVDETIIETPATFAEYFEYMKSLQTEEIINPIVGDTVISTHYDYFGNNQIRDLVDFYRFNGNAYSTPCMTAMVRYYNSASGARVSFAISGTESGYNPFFVWDTLSGTFGKNHGWPMVRVPKSGNLAGTGLMVSHISGNTWFSTVDFQNGTANPRTSYSIAGTFPSIEYDPTNDVIWMSNINMGIWKSTNSGASFSEHSTIDGGLTQNGGPTEYELYASGNGQHLFSVNAFTFNGDGEIGGIPLAESDYVLATYSDNYGDTWNYQKIAYDGFDGQVANRPNYAPTIENFGQVQGMVDDLGTRHVVANGHSWKWTDKPNNLGYFVYPVLYYNSEINTWVAVSDPAIEELELSAYRPGNGLGQSYPCITGSADGEVLVMLYQVPELSNGQPRIYSGGTDSIWYTDIYAVKSTDGGVTWTAPFPVANKQFLSEAYPTASARIDMAEGVVHFMYLEDPIPGTSLFTLNNQTSLCRVIYKQLPLGVASSITVSVPTRYIVPGDTVLVPVTIENVNNLGALTIAMAYDTTALDYIDAVNWSPLTPDALAGEEDGIVYLGWDNPSGISSVIEKLVDLRFIFHGDTAALTFLPGESELTDASGTPFPVTFTNGSLIETLGYSISGTVNYRNTALTPLPGADIVLMNAGAPLDTVIVDNTGNFQFYPLSQGAYPLITRHSGLWHGVNSTDALQVRRFVVNLQTFDSLQVKAADVNRSNTVNSTDALLIRRRVVRIDTTFVRGDWAFETPTILVSGGSVTQNILGLCTGDVNGSNIPGVLKATPTVNLLTKGTLETQEGKDFNIPVHISTRSAIGAVTLMFEYPEESVEIKGITSKMNGMLFSAKDGILTIAWDDIAGAMFTENEPLFNIIASVKNGKFVDGTLKLLTEFSEIADIEANVLPGVTVTMPEIGLSLPTEFSLAQNFPNPFNPSTTIQYDIPTNAHVRIEIFNTLGEVVEVLSDAVQAPGRYTVEWNAKNFTTGVYFYRMTAESGTKNYTQVKKLMLVK